METPASLPVRHVDLAADSDSRKAAQRGQWVMIVAATLVALFVRMYCVETTVVDGPVRGDAVAYVAYASNLAEYGVFSSSKPGAEIVLDSYRDPGYPFLVAALMRLVGEDAWYPVLLRLQAILGAGTVAFTLLLGRRWLAAPWLGVAGLIMALWPHSVTITTYILTETLAGFLSLAWLWLLSVAGERWRVSLVAGVVAGMAGLTTAVLLPAGVVVALLLWATRKLGRASALALLIGSLLLPGAWALRGVGLTDTAITSSSSGRAAQNLVQGSWPEYHDSWRDCIYGDQGACLVQGHIESEISRLHADLGDGLFVMMQRMADDPLKYAAWYLSKPRLLWGWSIRIGQGDVFVYLARASPYHSNGFFRVTSAIAYALNFWLFVFAAALCAGVIVKLRVCSPEVVVLAAFLLNVTAVYWLFQSEPRYSIPFRNLQILAAVSTVMFVAAWWRTRPWTAQAG